MPDKSFQKRMSCRRKIIWDSGRVMVGKIWGWGCFRCSQGNPLSGGALWLFLGDTKWKLLNKYDYV